MTVIREKQAYNYPKPSSAATSDTESLHLGSEPVSDVESLNDEYVNTSSRNRSQRINPFNLKHLEDQINIRKSSGKKKWRRYQNKCMLQTLSEDDEDSEFIVIMEPYKTPFARLLEDKLAMDYWQEFIEKSEQEQNDIVQAFSKSVQDNIEHNFLPEKPGKISSRIRRTFKIRKNLSLDIVKVCEEDLIEFFRNSPSDIYVKCPPTSFDRLLLHGIAQYHKLSSISVLTGNDLKRSIKVYNTSDNWVPANCFLFEFIKQLRKEV